MTRRSPEFVTRKVAGRTLLLPMLPGQQGLFLYELNETSAYLWDCLEKRSELADSPEELARCLQEEFEIEATDALIDAQTFVTDLKTIGALK